MTMILDNNAETIEITFPGFPIKSPTLVSRNIVNVLYFPIAIILFKSAVCCGVNVQI